MAFRSITISTTAGAAVSNSVSAGNAPFKMIRLAKNILSAGLPGLALGLLVLPAMAAPTAMPVDLPLYFEARQVQADAPEQFMARGQDYQFLIAPTEVQIGLRQTGAKPAGVHLQFAGANLQALICGGTELPGKINYLTGNNPERWRTGVPMFAQVRVGGLYPGVDLVYYGNQHRLEYDFTVAPGANPQAITMHFDGADKITISPQDELVLSLAGGEIRQPKPVIYQTTADGRKEITGGYRMVDAHTVAFTVGKYDLSQPLVIDPFLSYSSYFGGNNGDTAYAVALDTNGNVYVTGQTLSTQFSATKSFSTPGAFQTNFAGGGLTGDAFVCKFNAQNHVPAYLTYLGGSADDGAFGIAVDPAGNAYLTGFTDSPNFPTSTNALYKTISGILDPSYGYYPVDAFVTELDSSGSNLVYSTYLGGSSTDCGKAIALDATGNAYVTGFTYSSNFPTVNALQKNQACTNSFFYNANAFIAKIGPGGSPLVYSTYFGGTNFDSGTGIAVDTNGFVYVTGYTASTNFPTTNFVHQLIGGNMVEGNLLNRSTNITFSYDAFVAKLDPTGTNLVYSTLLGSTNNDVATGIVVDNTGAAYVTGGTISSNFPNTIGTSIPGLSSFLATNTSGSLATNVFLTKITDDGTNAVIAWSALFGGNGVDIGNAVALDPAGDIFVTGSASSVNFPTFNVPSLMLTNNAGQSDAFVIAFSATVTNLLYSTYLGGQNNDYGYGIAVYTNGNAYVIGQTLSANFLTNSALHPSLNGVSDAFLTIITLTTQPPVITTQPASQTVGVGTSVNLSASGTGTFPFYLQWQRYGVDVVNGGNISGATNSATLTISSAQLTNAGAYWLIVTNYGGAITSSPAYLGVTNVFPSIVVQPASQTNGVGTTVTLAVTAIGTAPLSYQWWLDGTNLVKNGGQFSGATTNVLTITGVQLTNSGTYTVIVTNMTGITNSATSSNAVLTVLSSPVILVQPATNQMMAVGSTAVFAATAVGTVPLRYQWWDGTNQVKNGTVNNGPTISGATTNVLTISNAQTTNSGTYTLTVTNISGSVTSSNAVLTVTNIPPSITVQPISQTNGVGTTVTFTVSGSGTQPFSFQWQKSGTNLVNGGRISGATNFTLTITGVQTNDSGFYSLIITNNGGSVTSSNAVLTVLAAPVITVQPATNQSMAVGSTAIFAVTAIGTVPLRYQWWDGTNQVKNGTVNHGPTISGATTNVLIISNAQTTNTGNYTVSITNVSGSVTSSVASLSVTNIPPTIISLQPTNLTLAAGSNVTFTVTATGTAPLSYQWQVGGTNLANGGSISGATTNKLTISNAQATNSGSYSVIVTNFGGSATSSNALLTVTNIPPTITLQPTNQTISMGSLATFVVTATGPAPLSYQWQVDGTNLVNGGSITGASTNILKISNASTNYSSTNYSVVITNLGGSVTSSVVSLTVLGAPVITMQPATNLSIAVGSNATFNVTAIGMVPLSYHWQLNGTNLVNGGQISGATSTNLIISNAQTNNSSPNYTVVVTNLAGSVTSLVASLTVTNIPPAITMQPMSQTNGVGTTVTLAVTATGTAPLSYRWQLNGTNLVNGGQFSGATTNALKISTVQLTNSGNYTVIITNFGGSVTSSVATLTVQASPIIVAQPTDQSMAVGATATFTVTAIGTVPLIYQWWDGTNLVKNGTFNGANISGAATVQLNISNAQTNNSGNYTVTVTNISGSVTSLVASLLVTNIPPMITSLQPTNQSVVAGSNVTFTITATGTAPLSYQWQVGGVNLTNAGNISGVTTTVLKINNAQTNNTGNYTVVVTNYGGSVTGSVGLAVASSPVILALQPTNQAVAVGSNPSFAVTAIGLAPLSYHWQLNGTNLINGPYNGGFISGATNTVLTFGDVRQISSGNYNVVITNSAGSVTSSYVVLTVTNIPPAITLQPTNQTVGAGSTITFVVTATGTAPLSYQWQVDETNLLVDGGQISGATTNVLTITNVQTTNIGNYTVTITNAGGSVTSTNALLTVTNIPPAIIVQPTNQTAGLGSTVTLTVLATGTAPLSYQWQMNETNLVDGGQFSGSISNILIISNVQLTNDGTYTVTITNLAGSVTSSNALLTVGSLSFTGIVAAPGGGAFILSGFGGTNNGTYYVLMSSNLLVPVTNWTSIATNQFDSFGGFIFTNTAQTNSAQEFYLLQMP
ncbi:MAG: immunoglobulin domain-containing protein [Verrucomicrobiia bacterium]